MLFASLQQGCPYDTFFSFFSVAGFGLGQRQLQIGNSRPWENGLWLFLAPSAFASTWCFCAGFPRCLVRTRGEVLSVFVKQRAPTRRWRVRYPELGELAAYAIPVGDATSLRLGKTYSVGRVYSSSTTDHSWRSRKDSQSGHCTVNWIELTIRRL